MKRTCRMYETKRVIIFQAVSDMPKEGKRDLGIFLNISVLFAAVHTLMTSMKSREKY